MTYWSLFTKTTSKIVINHADQYIVTVEISISKMMPNRSTIFMLVCIAILIIVVNLASLVWFFAVHIPSRPTCSKHKVELLQKNSQPVQPQFSTIRPATRILNVEGEPEIQDRITAHNLQKMEIIQLETILEKTKVEKEKLKLQRKTIKKECISLKTVYSQNEAERIKQQTILEKTQLEALKYQEEIQQRKITEKKINGRYAREETNNATNEAIFGIGAPKEKTAVMTTDQIEEAIFGIGAAKEKTEVMTADQIEEAIFGIGAAKEKTAIMTADQNEEAIFGIGAPKEHPVITGDKILKENNFKNFRIYLQWDEVLGGWYFNGDSLFTRG